MDVLWNYNQQNKPTDKYEHNKRYSVWKYAGASLCLFIIDQLRYNAVEWIKS